ncbi:MAG: acyl-CoA thioesterase [Sulfobacillus sp.]
MHRTAFRVRYGDTDRMGVVYYGTYADYFTVGRTEWMRDCKVPYREAFEEQALVMPVRRMSCRYLAPLHFDDALTVETSVSDLRPSRLTFSYRVLGPQGTLCAEGETEHAFWDETRKAPVNLAKHRPELWRLLQEAADGLSTDSP